MSHGKLNANISLLTEVIEPLPTLTEIIETSHRPLRLLPLTPIISNYMN